MKNSSQDLKAGLALLGMLAIFAYARSAFLAEHGFRNMEELTAHRQAFDAKATIRGLRVYPALAGGRPLNAQLSGELRRHQRSPMGQARSAIAARFGAELKLSPLNVRSLRSRTHRG